MPPNPAAIIYFFIENFQFAQRILQQIRLSNRNKNAIECTIRKMLWLLSFITLSLQVIIVEKNEMGRRARRVQNQIALCIIFIK